MSDEQTQPNDGLNPLQRAITQEQWDNLTQSQVELFKRGLSRLVMRHGEHNVTTPMIQGQYELVTEHLLPADVEAIYKS